MTQYIPNILSFVAGVLAGRTIKIQIDRRKAANNSSSQTGNTVGGDQAGRDIRK